MEDIIDLIATNSSASEISDKVKEVLFSKASEKIETLRPEIASMMFGDSESDTQEEE